MEKRIAFVLTGGGTKGAFQVGALKELIHRGIIPDIVFGTSIGAMNAAILLSSSDFKRNIKIMEEYWKSINRKDIMPINPEFFYKLVFSRSLYSTKGIENLLKRTLKKDDFSALSRPFYAVATNHSNGEPVFFHSGRLIEKILASTALPAFFPPKVINSCKYIDGGLSGEVGIKKAEELGYKVIILINLSSDPEKKSESFPKILETSQDSMILNNIEREISELSSSSLIEIRVGKKYSGRNLEFKSIKKLIASGTREAKKVLNKNKIYSIDDLKNINIRRKPKYRNLFKEAIRNINRLVNQSKFK